MSVSGDSARMEQLLNDVKSQLTCRVCLNFYTNPMVLPCLHIFCQRCIDSIATPGGRQGVTSVKCPTCTHGTDLAGVTAGLVPALHIQHLFDIHDAIEKGIVPTSSVPVASPCGKCRQFASTAYCRNCGQYICNECKNVHELWGELTSHTVVSIEDVRNIAVQMVPLKMAAPRCPKHSHKDLELYCETCDVLICHYCTIQLHKSHRYDLVADAYAAKKRAVEANVEPLRSHVTEVKEALNSINRSTERITAQRAVLEDDINRTIQELHEELERRKQEFLDQLNGLVQDKMQTLATQRAELEQTLTQMISTVTFTDERLRVGLPAEVLTVLKLINAKIDYLCRQHNMTRLEPLERANLIFCPGEMLELCKPVNAVCTAPICPSRCFMEEMPTTVVMGQRVAFSVFVKDDYGEPYTGAVGNFVAELVSPTARLQCDVKKTKVEGHYIVSCIPTTSRDHEFHVQIDGKHVQDSPSPVRVIRAIRDISKPIKIIKKLRNPRGIACNKKGEFVIVENSFPRVSIYTLHGLKRLRNFGSFGSAPGQFNDPDGVTVDSGDNILVVDSGNHRIQKFTAEGEFITAVGSKGDGPLQFNLPTNVKIHPQTGNMYVCDQYNHRIQIMKEDFSFVGTFGREGTQDGDLLHPTDLAFDSSGDVFVSDTKNNCIKVFDLNGHYMRKFGERRYDDSFSCGELEASYIKVSSIITVDHPSYMHVDADGNVFVANGSNDIAVFKTSGEFMTLFGKKGKEAGEFSNPCGLIVNKEGLICVSDSKNHRIQIF